MVVDEAWVSSAEALKIVIDAYSNARDGDRNRAELDATNSMQFRLALGIMKAKARAFSAYVLKENGVTENIPKEFDRNKENILPHQFWLAIQSGGFLKDWVAGDFGFFGEFLDSSGKVDLLALGVTFRKSDLPSCSREAQSKGVIARVAGRPKGAGGWNSHDAPIVEKMREMIRANPGTTAFGAAGHFASEAAGNAGLERKQRRLADRYRAKYAD